MKERGKERERICGRGEEKTLDEKCVSESEREHALLSDRSKNASSSEWRERKKEREKNSEGLGAER